MKQMKHWQDPVNALLGAWIVLSPWVVGYADERTAMANALVSGALLVAAAIGAVVVPKAWEEWVEVAIGVWLMASPWALGFAGHMAAMQNALFCGLAVTVLALWVLGTDDEYGGWLHRLVGDGGKA
jgi:hypothetical protein